MSSTALYQARYRASHALVIGVNKYKRVSPLAYARNDAEAVAELLVSRFGFQKNNVQLLLDERATRNAIQRAFLRFAESDRTGPDDRILVFFAGHGHTVAGRRGETGFLVPVDGAVSDLSTLIRWDDLTRNAELIPAKHILFIMDACYGGLALKRSAPPAASPRFVKSMLQRYTRQVLTAGKADEPVSDADGTRPGHSIFTSHLLDGLEGAAAPGGRIVTANAVMAYVYNKVGTDTRSHQTPHFGFIDGDGDFIFDSTVLARLDQSQSDTDDIKIEPSPFPIPTTLDSVTVSHTIKRLLTDSGSKIELNDFVSDLIRRAVESLNGNTFSTRQSFTSEEFVSRLQHYESAVSDLLPAVVLLAHWGEPEHIRLVQKVFARLAEAKKSGEGLVVWLGLEWYPLLILMYAVGISSLAAEKASGLAAALLTPVYSERSSSGPGEQSLVNPVIDGMTRAADSFKVLPDLERAYVPRSEHIFKKLQPLLEEQLHLGGSYDGLFDRFEIFLALCYADLNTELTSGHVWGPPGRFWWKQYGRLRGDLVYARFVSQAKSRGNNWEPLTVGFFRGSAQRFAEIADAFDNQLSSHTVW